MDEDTCFRLDGIEKMQARAESFIDWQEIFEAWGQLEDRQNQKKAIRQLETYSDVALFRGRCFEYWLALGDEFKAR